MLEVEPHFKEGDAHAFQQVAQANEEPREQVEATIVNKEGGGQTRQGIITVADHTRTVSKQTVQTQQSARGSCLSKSRGGFHGSVPVTCEVNFASGGKNH